MSSQVEFSSADNLVLNWFASVLGAPLMLLVNLHLWLTRNPFRLMRTRWHANRLWLYSVSQHNRMIRQDATLDRLNELFPTNTLTMLWALGDQFGIAHAPFATGRSFLTERGYGDCKVLIHQQRSVKRSMREVDQVSDNDADESNADLRLVEVPARWVTLLVLLSFQASALKATCKLCQRAEYTHVSWDKASVTCLGLILTTCWRTCVMACECYSKLRWVPSLAQ